VGDTYNSIQCHATKSEALFNKFINFSSSLESVCTQEGQVKVLASGEEKNQQGKANFEVMWSIFLKLRDHIIFHQPK
jgi:hypothetical protein